MNSAHEPTNASAYAAWAATTTKESNTAVRGVVDSSIASNPKIQLLAQLVALCESKPVEAAERFWRELAINDPRWVHGLFKFAEISDQELAAFEAYGPDVLVRIPWGQIWLVPKAPKPFTDSPALTVRSLRMLGIAVADYLATKPLNNEPAPETDYMAEAWND